MKPLHLAGILLLALSAPLLSNARPARQTPPLVPASMYGRDLFEFYCATCHGRDARGNGPAAVALVARVPDLTALAARNHGVFPMARVIAIVSGDAKVRAHGSREMPVWGPIFKSLDPEDTHHQVRIENLVAYVESLQRHKP